MADSMGSQYNLGHFTGNGVYFAKSESLRESDKRRFFQLNPRDSLTTVAISKVQLTGMKKNQTQNITYVNVLTRSQEDEHAEEQTVDEIKQAIKELRDSGAKLKALTLVMNITYSPCQRCKDVLQQFFENLDCDITFVLRFAHLYHEEGVKGDDKPVEQLANWMIGLERECGKGFTMRVESIEVTKELSSYSPRNTTNWESKKRERGGKDEAMKDTITQVYTKKRQIEEENRKRDEEAASVVRKMRI